MKEENKILSARGIAEIAIMAAIAIGLDFLQGGLWRGVFVNGGSIGLAMVPILVLCYRRGFLSGLVCGIVVAAINMVCDIYMVPGEWWVVMFQLLLDYVLAYPLVALAGIFYKPFQNATSTKDRIKWIIIGCVVGGLGKFMAHFLAGFIFWGSEPCWEAFTGMPVVYSLVYNGAYCLPNIIISTVILVILVVNAPQIFLVKKESKTLKEAKEAK